ncbi:MAG: fibronectin type III domain-containing protein [Nitrospira sp. CG24D]|nr:MAG: fibronectin type III domain-containing protein [Nitrospira sp. CG24D]
MRDESRNQSMRTLSICMLLTACTMLTGCGGGGEGAPAVSTSSSAALPTASLAWNPIEDSSIVGYYVHYGRQSPGQSGSCSYEAAQFVESPNATISDLQPDTRYYFTVSSYNGLESACSSEVSTVTPSSQA